MNLCSKKNSKIDLSQIFHTTMKCERLFDEAIMNCTFALNDIYRLIILIPTYGL